MAAGTSQRSSLLVVHFGRLYLPPDGSNLNWWVRLFKVESAVEQLTFMMLCSLFLDLTLGEPQFNERMKGVRAETMTETFRFSTLVKCGCVALMLTKATLLLSTTLINLTEGCRSVWSSKCGHPTVVISDQRVICTSNFFIGCWVLSEIRTPTETMWFS